jgi:hypothetical protein
VHDQENLTYNKYPPPAEECTCCSRGTLGTKYTHNGNTLSECCQPHFGYTKTTAPRRLPKLSASPRPDAMQGKWGVARGWRRTRSDHSQGQWSKKSRSEYGTLAKEEKPLTSTLRHWCKSS